MPTLWRSYMKSKEDLVDIRAKRSESSQPSWSGKESLVILRWSSSGPLKCLGVVLEWPWNGPEEFLNQLSTLTCSAFLASEVHAIAK